VLTLSASRIKLYQECRYRYYDRYILGIPDAPNTSALMGSAIHHAIETYYTKGRNPRTSFDRYMQRMLDWWVNSGVEHKSYDTFSNLMRIGRESVVTFPYAGYTPIALEQKFMFNFQDICMVQGIIDFETDIGIVDFKSSKKKPSQKELDNDPQFILYTYAYLLKDGCMPESVERYHLRDNTVMQFSLKDLRSRVDTLAAICNTIVNDTFTDITPQTRCKSCAPWCSRKMVT